MGTSNKESANTSTSTSKWNRWARRVGIALTLAFVFAVRAYPQAPPPPPQIELGQGSYTITDLGVLSTVNGNASGDTGSHANAINASGTVVGFSGLYITEDEQVGFVGFLNSDGFIWTPDSKNGTTGKMTYIGGLPGDNCFSPAYFDPYTGSTRPAYFAQLDSVPFDLNSAGQAAGYSYWSPDGSCVKAAGHGALYQNGNAVDLGVPPQHIGQGTSPYNFSSAFSINDAGQIVGSAGAYFGGVDNAWIYGGSYSILGNPPYPPIFPSGFVYSEPNKINNNGTLVGTAYIANLSFSLGFKHAGTGPLLASDVIGDLGGGLGSAAYGLNDSGMVVGTASVNLSGNLTSHAYLLDKQGQMHDLGTLSADPLSGSTAFAIDNTSFNIVGGSDIDIVASSPFMQPQHAALWASGGRPADLNLLLDPSVVISKTCSICWELVSATGINDVGQIVGEGVVGGLHHAFLLTPKCINDGGDTDGDGLCDNWEKNGYTDPKTGEFVNLPAMGAHWDHKDIFVQADYMVDSTIEICTPPYVCSYAHTHKPNPDAMAKVINAFANAPVENPDGFTGINIHIDCGRDCVMNPETGETWGDFSLAQAIDPEVTLLGDQLDDTCVPIKAGDCAYDWMEFDNIRASNFAPTGRTPIFHYMIFGHSIGVYSTNTKPDGSKGVGIANASGIGEIPDSNFIVSLGAESGQVGKPLEQAGTFMHELGHNLGLRHGGTDNINAKPNYLSVMNYSFQFGVITNGVRNAVDYSRFYQIPSLNENALNEQVGLNGGPLVANYGTFYYCYVEVPVKGGFTLQQQTRFVPNANSPIDWNCNGTIDTKTLTDGNDIDGLTDQFGDPTLTTDPLVGSEDWSHLIFAGGAVGQLGQGSGGSLLGEQAAEGPVPHLPVPYDVDVVSPGLAIVPPGASIANFTYTITNTGQQPDTYNLTAVSQYSNWWDISGVPATISLAAGASQQVTIPVTVPSSFGCSNLNSVHATFLLRATSQTYPTISESGAAELDLAVSHGTVSVPSVTGLTQSEGQAAIVAVGFVTGMITTSSSSSVPAGTVISQSPFGCGYAAPGAAISLVVSTGPAFVAMPNVVGETQAAASTAITTAGLVLVSVSTTASLTVPAGIVISESPAAGTNVLVGSSAGILVSSGASASDIVPNVVGQSLGAATTAIGSAGLVVGTTTGSVSSTVTAGLVISETPAAGTTATPGSSVNLTVSVGSSSYAVVPNIVGDTQAQALSAITSAGLLFGGLGQVSSTTVPAGHVISQNPLPGLFEFAGNLVYFTVSVGPEPNTVPNVYGLSPSMAAAALTAVGLKVGTISPYPSGIYPPGYVLSQNPAPGYYATAGSTVSLTIVAGPTQFIVPDLSATNAALGYEVLATAGLSVGSFTTALSSTISQSLLISQSPAAGTTVSPGSPVNAVYSAGSHLYPVPNVVGQGQDLATENILGAFFYVAVTRQSSTTVPDGEVISQTPAGGSQALLGAIISLVVSSGGPVTGTVPNTLYDPNAIPYGTVGTLGQAVQAIYAAGFAVGSVTTQIPPTSVFVPENYVISQSPAAGRQAPWGTSVSLVVSAGGGYSTVVPNLVGMTQAAAISTLGNAPVPPLLKGDAFWSYALTTQSSTTVPAGNVISQNPPPGAAIVQAPYQQQVGFSAYVLGPVSFVVSAGPTPVPSYSYLSQFGSNGAYASQDGQFSGLYALTIDPVSRNIIVGGEDGRIQIFDSNGNFKSYFGGYGLDLVTYSNANSLYELQIVDLEGPVGNGLFWTSTQLALAVDPVNRNIIAVDVAGQRVLIFNSEGVFQTKFGTAGLGPGQFRFANYINAGVAVDPVTENILVSDPGNSRVQVFNSAGVYLSQFGTIGGGDGQFGNPSGIAIDPTTRNIIVADWGANRVEIFNSSGVYLSQFGGPGASNGTFYEPTAIAIDPATHNILLASAGTGNTSNPYLQIFSSTGVYLSQFGGYGTGNGQFTGGETGLAFDPVSHNIIVTGSGGSVQIFGLAASSLGSTTTALVTSSNPASFGQSVTFTATVTGNSPTGTVQFLDGATSLGTPVALTAGVAALSTSSLAVGPHSITAVYGGDTSNPGSTSAALSETISPKPSATTVVSSANPVIAGQPVTFTATVTGRTPTGTVEFLNGATSLGAPVVLASGVAAFTTSTLPVGTDSITAVYSGDGSNATSTSAVFSEIISLAPTTTAVLSSAGHATFGQPVTFTALVSGDGPAGNVQFFDGATPLAAPVALTGNIATFATSTLAVGTHFITAAYKGDAFNSPSTSPLLSEFVSKNAPTTTSLATSVGAILIGQSVTFTATVTGSGPTGSVQFMDGVTNLGSPVGLTSGAASITTSALTVGTHPMTAVYSGDTTNAPSASAVISEVVSLNATATTVTSSANPAVTSQLVTFTATVSGKNPSGSILFLDGSTPLSNLPALGNGVTIPTPPTLAPNSHSILLANGRASLAISTLSLGTHSITAVYLGDGSNASSTSAVLSQAVQSSAAPPVVTPPAGISIPATQATGATSSASPLLAAFLADATATSTLPSAPLQLAPQVGGLAVNGSTVFPIGTTTVTFGFKDSNGNVGSATSTVTVAVGVPRITGSIAGIGSDPSGATYFNVVLTNTGTGNARSLVIKTLTYRVLAGTGTLTYNTALSPALPVTVGNLDVGATSITRMYLNVPSTVTRIAFVESGPVQDVTGTNYTYSTAQMVIP